MNVELSIKYNRRKKGKVEILVYQKSTRIRSYFSTGVVCSPEDWNNDKKIIRGEKSENLTKNIIISKTYQDLNDFAIQQYLANRTVDISLLRAEYENISLYKQIETFFGYLHYCINDGALRELKKSTKGNYIKLANHWRKYGKEDLKLNLVTPLELNKFNSYLIELGLENNSRWSLFKEFKRIMKIAVRDQILKTDLFPFGEGKFLIKYQAPQKTALTLDELKKIELSKVPEAMKPIKDMFLFSCYTGLRYSDVNRLCANMIKNNSNESYLVLTNQKGGGVNNIPISSLFNGKPLEIAKKYIELHIDKVDSFKWFDYTNEYINRELKFLQRYAMIETVLTMHVARHSCCTFLVADFKIKPAIAQKILGHSSLRMTEQYLHVRGTHIEDSLKNIEWG